MPEKVKAVVSAPKPRNIQELRFTEPFLYNTPTEFIASEVKAVEMVHAVL